MDTNHRTAPRWITEAIEVVTTTVRGGEVFQDIPIIDARRLPTALIERLPLEAMAAEICSRINAMPGLGPNWTALTTDLVVLSCAKALTDGDPEVVELTELYQGACRALDEAGVPYAIDVEVPASIVIESTIGELARHKPVEVRQVPAHPGSLQMGLPDRIRWLAQQRPIRAELESAQATRKLAEETAAKYMAERDEANRMLDLARTAVAAEVARAGELAAERDQLQKMYKGASDDLDRERTAHQEAQAAASNREIARAVDLDNARNEARMLKDAVIERNTHLRSLVESDMPAGNLRRALAELIGMDAQARVFAATDRQVLRAKVADQAAYIEQLEAEIDALEDEIWEDEP